MLEEVVRRARALPPHIRAAVPTVQRLVELAPQPGEQRPEAWADFMARAVCLDLGEGYLKYPSYVIGNAITDLDLQVRSALATLSIQPPEGFPEGGTGAAAATGGAGSEPGGLETGLRSPAQPEATERSQPEPGYLGLIVDEGKREVRRQGRAGVVHFGGRDIPWRLLRELIQARDNYSPKYDLARRVWDPEAEAELPDDGSIWNAVSQLRRMINPLGVGIKSIKNRCRLTERG
jgi:hypothetical protein